MDNSQYLDIFIEESREHLQQLNQNILELEKDQNNMEIVNEMFRAAHTLKGMSGTMGFNTVMELTHSMENALDEIRNGKAQVTTDIIDLLFKGVDLLEALIEDIEETGEEGQRDNIEEILNQFKGGGAALKSKQASEQKSNETSELILDQYQQSILKTGMDQGLNSYWIKVELQETCVLKSARAYLIFQTLEKFGEIIKTNPSTEDIEEEKFDYSFDVVFLSSWNKQKLQQELEKISEIESIEIKQLSEQTLENLSKQDTSPEQKTSKPDTPTNDVKKKAEARTRRSAGSIRVDIEKLDSLMNLVSELIIVKNRIERMASYQNDTDMMDSLEYLTRITTELHDAVTQVRMVPIEMVFNRFPRVVRDLARETGKKVELNIVGAETEVDRTIVDEIGDPLIHLLRNAVDHGLETPEDRIKANKSETGKVDLISYHDGNNVVIEIGDDGRGIDIEKIGRKAVEKGLVEENELNSLDDKEIINFMFHPGFSTAQEISNISGRGVGLDVVKTKVESLGGVIEVDTKKGAGTRFIIRLPLTLSIIQALLVKVGQEIYAIPLSSIQEIIDISANDIQYVAQQELIPYRGKLIPLIHLHQVLEVEENNEIQKESHITAVIVKKGDKLSALSIGGLEGQQEIVIKSLGKYLSDIKIIAGATILGDGSVALILDINHLV